MNELEQQSNTRPVAISTTAAAQTLCPRCGGAGEILYPLTGGYWNPERTKEYQCPACYGQPMMSLAEADRIKRNIERYLKPRGIS